GPTSRSTLGRERSLAQRLEADAAKEDFDPDFGTIRFREIDPALGVRTRRHEVWLLRPAGLIGRYRRLMSSGRRRLRDAAALPQSRSAPYVEEDGLHDTG